ncbi:hypothetical protein [Planomonospora alba]
MFARTFSAEDADLSLLPEPDAFDHVPEDGPAPDDAGSGPFGADGTDGAQDPWESSGADGDPYTPDGDHGDHGDHGGHDDHEDWDVFGGDV